MSDDVSTVFAALSDATRRRLFERLLEHPRGCTATELAEDAAVSRQAIVKHLQLLAGAQLAVASRDGREVRYRASTRAAQDASIVVERSRQRLGPPARGTREGRS